MYIHYQLFPDNPGKWVSTEWSLQFALNLTDQGIPWLLSYETPWSYTYGY